MGRLHVVSTEKVDYPPIHDFDPRSHYYDGFKVTASELYGKTKSADEVDKHQHWTVPDRDLDLGLALDPLSCAAKVAMAPRAKPESRKRKAPEEKPYVAIETFETVDPPASKGKAEAPATSSGQPPACQSKAEAPAITSSVPKAPGISIP